MTFNQIINFNPTSQEHREDFYTFLKEKSFKNCRNRYALEGNFGDVASMMMQQVVNYYTNLEFEKPR